MLKFTDLDRSRFKVCGGGAERLRNDSRLLASLVDRPTLCRRREIGWNAPCVSRAAPARLLQKRLVQGGGDVLGLPFLQVQPTQGVYLASSASPDSPDRLAATVAVDDWDFIVAFVAPDLTGGTEDMIGRAIRADGPMEVR